MHSYTRAYYYYYLLIYWRLKDCIFCIPIEVTEQICQTSEHEVSISVLKTQILANINTSIRSRSISNNLSFSRPKTSAAAAAVTNHVNSSQLTYSGSVKKVFSIAFLCMLQNTKYISVHIADHLEEDNMCQLLSLHKKQVQISHHIYSSLHMHTHTH